MEKTEFYRWWVPDAWSGKLGLTRYRMTVQEAQKRFPGCKPDLQSREVRSLPETPEEATIPADAPYARGRDTPSDAATIRPGEEPTKSTWTSLKSSKKN